MVVWSEFFVKNGGFGLEYGAGYLRRRYRHFRTHDDVQMMDCSKLESGQTRLDWGMIIGVGLYVKESGLTMRNFQGSRKQAIDAI